MADICVAHLVRANNGIGPLTTFLQSYKKNEGGVERDLLLIFKGFHEKELPARYRELLGAYPHQALFVPDRGYDVVPYFIAADTCNYRFFCFLNSFSVILDEDWLRKMYTYITKNGVGIVGATGSYQSMHGGMATAWKTGKGRPLYRRMLSLLGVAMRSRTFREDFVPFPNYHIRTNVFMIARDLMRKVAVGPIRTKMDAYRFESGKNSLTRQVLRMNLRALVIGRNGKAYDKEEWVTSFTFWQGDQSNLLVADKQTYAYVNGDLKTKWRLARRAWGDDANPLAIFDDKNRARNNTPPQVQALLSPEPRQP